MKKPLKPECDYTGMVDYHPNRMRRGLAPVEGMFEGSPYLDQATKKNRRRMASTRTGSPTREAQSLVQVTRRECPWQLWGDSETGTVEIQRRYDPADEPLTEHVFENTEAEVA